MAKPTKHTAASYYAKYVAPGQKAGSINRLWRYLRMKRKEAA